MSDPPSQGDKPASVGGQLGRNANGTFTKGTIGNPAGRALGSRNKATIACEQLLDRSGKKLTKLAIEKAEAGDPMALRLTLDRIIPPRRERPRPFTYIKPKSAAEVPQAINAILEQMASGELTASEGAAIISGIETLRAAYATADLEARVKALEEGRLHNEPGVEDREA